MTPDSTYSFVVISSYEATANMIRRRYRPGCLTVRGLKLAYPLLVFPCPVSTLDVRAPAKFDVMLVPVSLLRDAFITNCFVFPGCPKGQTAMTTGMLKGTPGRAVTGGAVLNEILYSRLELPVPVFLWIMVLSLLTLLPEPNDFSLCQGWLYLKNAGLRKKMRAESATR